MTDKEQKKWHEEKWGQNEEPEETPAERPHCDYDSLKNQDKNFNENYSQNKEQIIIDGVDVSECERHCSDNYNTPNMCYSDITRGYRHCNPKENQCDFYITSIEEQLARKTQECEQKEKELLSNEKIINKLIKEVDELKHENWELKEEIEALEKINRRNDQELLRRLTYSSNAERQRDRYHKALEEIEEIVKQTCRKRCTNDCLGTKKHCGYGAIFKIVNKAKLKENEQ